MDAIEVNLENKIHIRPEKESDFDRIEEITVSAFRDHPFSENIEHLIIRELRKTGDLSLSLIAEVGGTVVGHIAISPVTVGGKDVGWYGVGPLSVQPEFQNQGVGSALVRAGLKILEVMGAGGCALVGDPNYYRRFGFKADVRMTLVHVPPENFMVFAFKEPPPMGEVVFHPAFSVKAEED